MAEDKDILDKLSKSVQQTVQGNMPTTALGKKDLKDLLHFGALGRGQTTEDSRLEVRAILVAAVSQGMPLEVAKTLKETLRTSPPQRTKDLLADINSTDTTPKAALSKFMTENQVGAKLTAIDPNSLTGVTIKTPTTVSVSSDTAQNLGVAHSINFAVKSIITDGAPNQAPDVVRTAGRNYLLFDDQKLRTSVIRMLGKDKQHQADLQRAKTTDKQIGSPDHSEEYGNVVEMSQITAITGTGKCGEHAATSFALLTDPKSLAKLGVEIPDGSTVILALGDKIDHNYVLIAAPGSVDFTDDDGKRRLNVKDPNSVVVVDPWMPIPTAHTLSRCNDEIQLNPQVKMAVVMRQGQPLVLDRTGKETALTQGDVSTLDQMNTLKEKYRPTMLKNAEKEGIVPKNEGESLATACGRLEGGVLGMGKPPPYESTHMSTDTPHDQYQTVTSSNTKVGKPISYFQADQGQLTTTHNSIEKVNKSGIEKMAFDSENLKLMPTNLREMMEHAKKVKESKQVEQQKPKTEVDKPTVKLRDDVRMKDVPKPKIDEPKIEIDQPKTKLQTTVGHKEPGKLRDNPQMAKFMTKLNEVDGEKQGTKVQKVK